MQITCVQWKRTKSTISTLKAEGGIDSYIEKVIENAVYKHLCFLGYKVQVGVLGASEVKTLTALVNKNCDGQLTVEKVGEFYDRFMAGSIDKAIIGYLDRYFEFYAKISREFCGRVAEFFDLWLKHQYKTRGKKDVDEDDELVLPRKQMKETLKGLKAAKDGLEALKKDSWAIISAYSIIPD